MHRYDPTYDRKQDNNTRNLKTQIQTYRVMNSLTYIYHHQEKVRKGFLLCTILNSGVVCRIESESREDISAKKGIAFCGVNVYRADLHLSLVQSYTPVLRLVGGQDPCTSLQINRILHGQWLDSDVSYKWHSSMITCKVQVVSLFMDVANRRNRSARQQVIL